MARKVFRSFLGQEASDSSGSKQADESSVFLSQYRLKQVLGIGAFGKVRLAEHVITQHKVAVKILDLPDLRRRDLEAKVRKEMSIMGSLVHPHIVRLYELIETDQRWYAVMEYGEKGELFDYLQTGKLEESEARRLFQQLISAVEYCHTNKVVHRDLKPENILLDRNLNLKVADFGLSNHIRDGQFLKTSCGSANYAAPEVICGKLYSGPEVDVWSCGVILYAMLANCLPFDNANISELFRSIQTASYRVPDHMSSGVQDLVVRMLTVDPVKRITIDEIKQHPWYREAIPPYLTSIISKESLVVDPAVLNAVQALGFDRQYILSSLQHNAHNVASVTYYLLLDKQKCLRESKYQAGPPTPTNLAASGGVMDLPTGMHPCIPGVGRWEFGCSVDKTPSCAMEDIVQALTAQGIRFKRPGPYTLHCRKVFAGTELAESLQDYVPGSMSHGTSRELKFEVQLYKNGGGSLFVDIQVIGAVATR
eukprot:jgi/Botrbrau1/18569/Bobra.0367s0014.3